MGTRGQEHGIQSRRIRRVHSVLRVLSFLLSCLLAFFPSPFRFCFLFHPVCLFIRFSFRPAWLMSSRSVESNRVESSPVRYFVEFIRVNSHRVQPCRVQSSPQSHQVESRPVIVQLSIQVIPVAQARDKESRPGTSQPKVYN